MDPNFIAHLARGGLSEADYNTLPPTQKASLFQVFSNQAQVKPPQNIIINFISLRCINETETKRDLEAVLVDA